jgi:hypothetical protein
MGCHTFKDRASECTRLSPLHLSWPPHTATQPCPAPLPPHRDWDQSEGFPASLGNTNNQSARKCRATMTEFLYHLKAYLISHTRR